MIIPKGFFSYVRQVDDHDGGRLTRLRERLQGEIRVQTGLGVDIFQDIRELRWGDRWRSEILESLAESYFLIPVVTPGYFLSTPCREEYTAFKDRQQRLDASKRGVILPVYYVETDELSDPAWRDGNDWATDLHASQWADWRTLRLEPWESPLPNRRIEEMARQFKNRLKAMGILTPPGTAPTGGSPIPATTAATAATTPSTEAATLPPADHVAVAASHRRELVVDANGKGQFKTIADAIRAAGTDDTIVVRPGIYQEALVLDKSLTLIGDGQREDIIIEGSTANALSSTAPFGRVVNFTFRQAAGGQYAIDISSGHIELEYCDIASQGLSCIAVHGNGDPTVRRSRIHDSKQSGIFVYSNGRGTFEDNDIFANAFAGISVKEGSDPTVRRNTIRDAKQNGISVYQNGRGTFEDNDIFANILAGIVVRDGAEPTVRRNRIHDGQQGGIMVLENGRGIFEHNDVFANAMAGIEVRGSDPLIRHNRVRDGKQSGIFVHSHGRGTFEENDIFENTFAGIAVTNEGDPIIRRNKVRDGKQTGIFVYDNGRGTFEDNDIVANASAGIAVRSGATPTVRANRINRNGYEAIWIYEGGRGSFVENDLRNNKRGVWDVASDCLPYLTRQGNSET